MAIDPVITWKSEWANLPIDPIGTLYPANIASFIGQRVTTKLTLAPPFSGTVLFTFNNATFMAGITGLSPSPTPAAGAAAFAAAWESAILASVIIIPPGAFIGVSSPATLFSVVTTVVPIVTPVAKTILQAALIAAPPALTALASAYPVELFSAFFNYQYLVTGINSIVPTPTPLIFTGTPM